MLSINICNNTVAHTNVNQKSIVCCGYGNPLASRMTQQTCSGEKCLHLLDLWGVKRGVEIIFQLTSYIWLPGIPPVWRTGWRFGQPMSPVSSFCPDCGGCRCSGRPQDCHRWTPDKKEGRSYTGSYWSPTRKLSFLEGIYWILPGRMRCALYYKPQS